jgi:multicomponent K+:H+ antiporter subunit E
MIRSWLPHPVYCLFLAVGWMVLKEGYAVGDFLIGYVIGAVIVRILGDFWPGPVRVTNPLRLLRLLADFVHALVVANLTVAWTVIRPKLDIQPAFIVIPLDLEDDFRITMLASMITLTPGTLSVDVAADRSALYVHCLSAPDPDAVREEIKRVFEKGIMESIS